MKRIPLTKHDETALFSYISDEPEINLFISGDVYTYGLEGPNVNVWAFLDGKGSWKGVLLRYMKKNYIFYSRSLDFPENAVASTVKQDNPSLKGVCLSGKKILIEKIAPLLSPLKKEETMMARCNKLLPQVSETIPFVTARLLGKSDFHELFVLLSQIKEFTTSAYENEDEAVKRWTMSINKGSAIFGVFLKGELVATAASTADSPIASMLVGVATKPGFRRKGYASLAVQSLLADRFGKGQRFLCLFYDNPEAGRIYHKFGFVDVDAFTMVH